MLNEIISFLAYDPSLSLLITGFADKSGNSQSNLELSRKRALKVRDYMLVQGIGKDRMIMNYFGDRQSRGENPLDRRVEVGMVRL
jgi:outer membrane protein OmpA-like peptidoglycan-associated protein